jgi:hypothetical protein
VRRVSRGATLRTGSGPSWPPLASVQARWQAQDHRLGDGPEHHLLCAAHRHALALPAQGPPSLAYRLPLFPYLAPGGGLGAGAASLGGDVPLAVGPAAEPKRHPGRPVGQDHRRGTGGYDAGKKVDGRKRQLLVGSHEAALKALVHPASESDKVSGRALSGRVCGAMPGRRPIWGDCAYRGLGVRARGLEVGPGGWAVRLQGAAAALDSGAA